MATKTNGIIAIVVIVVIVGILYYLYKNGFPLPKELKDLFAFLESIPKQISVFFGDIGKGINDALAQGAKDFSKFADDVNKNLNDASKDLTIVNPIDADALSRRGVGNNGNVPSSGFTAPPTKTTKQTSTTKTIIETNLNTGSDKVVGQNKTINLVETLSFTEQAAYRVAAAKETSKTSKQAIKDAKQYEITHPTAKSVKEITQLGKIPNPLTPRKSPLDILLGDLQNIFNNNIIPVFPVTPIPTSPVIVIP